MNIGKLDYDGALIHSRFAYTYFRDKYIPTGCVIAFRGKMNVTTNLIDKEDLLNNDFIFSEDAINFCWEIPNLCAFGGVAFQRLFCTYVANALSDLCRQANKEIDLTVMGDDLMVRIDENKFQKASVSISTVKDGAVLGHLGINVVAGNRAPSFAYSTQLTDEEVETFANNVIAIFNELTASLFVATTKTV